jgi:hypothetical protein
MSWTRIGIDSDHTFIPLSIPRPRTVVHSESCVPTEWKKTTGTVVHFERRRHTYLLYNLL